MKLSSKPISSPGRTEKFPPPLMRFLRSNVGSRSRGRSRSSPMFVRKKNAPIETQEPSSPKVTCIGQVRVRRSKQGGRTGRPGRAGAPTRRRRCRWIRKTLLCHYFSGKVKPRSFQPDWRKWVMFFQVGYRRKTKIQEDSSKSKPRREAGNVEQSPDEEQGRDSEDEEEQARVFVSSFCSPPKNAFLLTRCRSAPYRSSSLASRFWGSPLRTEETGEELRTEAENRASHIENTKPTSEDEPTCRDSAPESRKDKETEEKLRFFKEFEVSIDQNIAKSTTIDDLNTGEVGSGRPLILTRCKSAPARRFEKVEFC